MGIFITNGNLHHHHTENTELNLCCSQSGSVQKLKHILLYISTIQDL